MAHWVAEIGKLVFLAQSFSQYRNLGLHSQIGWAVSKTLLGALVWSLFYIFSISYNNFSDVSNSCFSSSLTWSQLTCLYFLMQRILPKASWGPVVSEQNYTFFFLKIHFPSAWFLHVICVLYHFFGKMNTLTSGLLLYSYACPWHILELQRALCCSGISALPTCRMMFCVSSGGCIWNLFLQVLMMVMSMTQSRSQRPFGEDITSWTLKSSSCSIII